MKIRHLLIFIIFFSDLLYSQSENIRFDKLTVEDGLSDNRVLSIIQDSKGFMWFGTIKGLNRYDGYSFKKYMHNSEDSLWGISKRTVSELFEDHLENLWVGTLSGGLYRYDREHDIFIEYKPEKDNPNSLSGSAIVKIFETDQNILWIGCSNGLNKYNPETDNFTRYYPEKKEPQFEVNINFIADIIQDFNGKLWVGTWNKGLFYYDDAADRFLRYTPLPEYSNVFPNQYTIKLAATVWGNKPYLWFAGEQNLYSINIKNDKITRYKLQAAITKNLGVNRITTLYHPNKSSEIWIGTGDGGLFKYDMASEAYTSYSYQTGNPYSLSSNTVFSVFKDKNGLLWVGTPHGINKLSTAGKTFSTLRLDGGNPEGISGEAVWSICETITAGNQSVLWFGTEDGLFSYNRSNGSFRRYRHDPRNRSSLSHTIVTPIIKTQSGNGSILWAGSENGLNKIDPLKNQITRYYISEKDPVYNIIYALCSDKNGLIWLGTQSPYLIQFDPRSTKFKKYGSHYGPIRTLYIDSSGILWIGTLADGLFAYNPATNEEHHYENIAGNFRSINDNWVSSITEDKNGAIWIGTGTGFNKFNRTDSTFTRFSERDGLIGNLVKAILTDANGNLWISTDKGLSNFNPGTETFRRFTENDGLHNNEFWWAAYKNKKGEMFFGGKNGLTWFHPDSIKINNSAPPVVLTDFQIFNKKITPDADGPLKKEISETREITLSHDQSVFSFEFAALEYLNPQKISYAYRMDKVDPDWVLTDASHRYVTYTNLDPGTYQFHVKTANKDGIWNPQLASIKITILSPWYASGWAYALYIISFLALLYYIRRYELNRLNLKHEAAKWQEMDSIKSKFFANISHEFRTPLTLILSPLQQFIDKSSNSADLNQFSLMKRNTLHLQQLINQLLDLSRIEAGRLKLAARETDIIRLTRHISAAFESLAESRDIQLIFNSNIEKLLLYIDPDKIEKIISNLLGNALKFSDDNTEIQVSVNKQEARNGDQSLCIIKIKDQGIGISTENLGRIFERFYQADASSSRAYEGSGIGLALVRELVELHHGRISAESELARGTTFTIQLPLGKEHLSADEILAIPAEEIRIENNRQSSEILEGQLAEINTGSSLPLILVVEDNRDVQSYLAGVLEKDYNLIFAANGHKGIEQSFLHIPDLIVSDVMMPGMDGFEMCRTLKDDLRTSHIPVILLTARAGQQNKLEGLDTGADDYLTKPFDTRELQTRIHNLIEQRRKLQEKFSRQNPFNPQQLDFNENDRSFLAQVIEIVNKNINNPSFNTEMLADKIALSRTQLFRKLKSLTGKSVSEFIRFTRLQHAAQMLRHKQGNVSEVAYSAGFNHLGNFSEHFKKQFGVLPSEYLKYPEKNILDFKRSLLRSSD